MSAFGIAVTRRQKEFITEMELLEAGVEAYVAPLIEQRSPRYLRGKKVLVKVPLYPRYLFYRHSEEAYVAIMTHKNVVGIVRFGELLGMVREEEIVRLKQRVAEHTEYMDIAYRLDTKAVSEKMTVPILSIGDEVSIQKGLLTGGTGEYVGERRGRARIVMLRGGKEFAVDLPFDHIEARG